jgi:hypothetical protein
LAQLLGVGVGLGVEVGVGVAVAVAIAVGVGVGVSYGVAVAVDVAVGVAVGLGVTVGVGVEPDCAQLSPAGVQIGAVVVHPVAATPNDHFVPCPHRCVIVSGMEHVCDTRDSPTVGLLLSD